MFALQWISTILVLLILNKFVRTFFSPTSKIPGPWAARFTKLWYSLQVNKGDMHYINIKLHRQMGKIVRLAPNNFSIDDPDALKIIYGHGSTFEKSEWYDGWQITEDTTKTHLFAERNSKRHAISRRNVASLYSMTALISYEAYVDNCIQILHDRLEEFCALGTKFNLAHWLQCYAFDVIGEISFGKRFGFLDKGTDIENIIRSLDDSFTFATNLGIWTEMKPLVNTLVKLFGGGPNAGVVRFTNESIDRARNMEAEAEKDASPMITKLLNIQANKPESFPEWDIFATLLNNIGAGSDTTAISLSAVLFYTLKTPRVLQKLRQEIDYCSESDVFPFKRTQDMPYLQATIKEALRIHAGTGLPLWRKVPKGGREISGQYFPEDTNVGVNSWVAHRNPRVFGDDADVFRPERWLEADAEGLKEMERNFMPFGLGSRTCIGKNVSLLEMNKLVPVLFRDFVFELSSKPGENLPSRNVWFVKPTDFYVKVSRRTKVQSL